MSHFLCGEIQFRQKLSWGEREDLAFTLSELALSQRLSIQLAFNITQRTVFEILHRNDGGIAETDIAFFLTDSPISNVSDQLVSSINVAPLDLEMTIREGMRRVERFLTGVAKIECLAAMSLYLSQGYDTAYQKEEISIEFLANRVVDFFTELHHMPSTQFLIQF